VIALPHPRALGAALAALVVTAALVAALMLASTHTARVGAPRPGAAPDLNSLIHGAPLQRARCTNWMAANPAERALASHALAMTVGGPTEYKGVRGTTLTDAETYALLDNACSARMARHFLIYELYIRAAGFRSQWANRP
jgi:hypothetical protein